MKHLRPDEIQDRIKQQAEQERERREIKPEHKIISSDDIKRKENINKDRIESRKAEHEKKRPEPIDPKTPSDKPKPKTVKDKVLASDNVLSNHTRQCLKAVGIGSEYQLGSVSLEYLESKYHISKMQGLAYQEFKAWYIWYKNELEIQELEEKLDAKESKRIEYQEKLSDVKSSIETESDAGTLIAGVSINRPKRGQSRGLYTPPKKHREIALITRLEEKLRLLELEEEKESK